MLVCERWHRIRCLPFGSRGECPGRGHRVRLLARNEASVGPALDPLGFMSTGPRSTWCRRGLPSRHAAGRQRGAGRGGTGRGSCTPHRPTRSPRGVGAPRARRTNVAARAPKLYWTRRAASGRIRIVHVSTFGACSTDVDGCWGGFARRATTGGVLASTAAAERIGAGTQGAGAHVVSSTSSRRLGRTSRHRRPEQRLA